MLEITALSLSWMVVKVIVAGVIVSAVGWGINLYHSEKGGVLYGLRRNNEGEKPLR